MISKGGFLAYYRVSTGKQGKSGLGIEAQRQAVANYLNGGNWRIVGEFIEVESGRRSDCPELDKALVLGPGAASPACGGPLAAAKRRGKKLGGDRGAKLTAKARAAGCGSAAAYSTRYNDCRAADRHGTASGAPHRSY